MVALQIDEDLAEKLEVLAKSRGYSIQATLAEAIEYYAQAQILHEQISDDNLEGLIGMAEADVDDLSLRARQYVSVRLGPPCAT
ncbi:MAG: hypothetical protein ACYDBJ_14100 [Aggregatilineales bacterium]